MARNLNQLIPRYVESDLNKSKISKPPRIKSKETTVYIYETNQAVTTVEKTTSALSIQSKYSFQIDIQITSPLNFDISSPKFASLSDSGIWGGQINGFIFDDINLDTSKYNYITFNLETNQSIKLSQKYRIVSVNKKYDTQNKYIYSTIVLAPDSISTIPAYQKLNWRLVTNFENDKKTKYLKIAFDWNTIFFPNAINVAIIPEKGEVSRNDGITITNTFSSLVFKLIKIRKTNPVQIDDLTLSDLQDRSPLIKFSYEKNVDRNWPANSWDFRNTYVKGNYDGEKRNFVEKKQFDFFSYGLNITNSNRNGKGIANLEERIVKGDDWNKFFNGTFSIDGEKIENESSLIIEDEAKKLEDLTKSSKNDRYTFVLSQPSDLSQYLESVRTTEDRTINTAPRPRYDFLRTNEVRAKNNFPKTRLLSEQEFGKWFQTTNDIVIDVTLQRAGFNPKITLETLMCRKVKITQYDENHRIINSPDLNFETEFAFDDSKTQTVIQL